MTPQEWLTKIQQALTVESSTQTDRSGATPYFLIFEQIRKAKSTGQFNVIADAIRLLAAANQNAGSDWWLRAANLLYSFAPMQVSEKARLADSFEGRWPQNVEARSYVLRALSDLGCPINWAQVDLWNDVKTSAPLLLVDAMIRGRRMSDALKLIGDSITRGRVTAADLTIVLPRWQKRLSAVEAKQLARGVRPQETEGQTKLWEFAEGIRGIACVFVRMDPNHPRIPAHLAAHHNQQRFQH